MTATQVAQIRARADPTGDPMARHDLRQAQADRVALLQHVDELEASMQKQALLLSSECSRMSMRNDRLLLRLGECPSCGAISDPVEEPRWRCVSCYQEFDFSSGLEG